MPNPFREIRKQLDHLDELEPDELIELRRSIAAAKGRCGGDTKLRAQLETMQRRVMHHLALEDPRMALFAAVKAQRRVGGRAAPSVWAELVKLEAAAKARARALPINVLDRQLPTLLELAIEFKPEPEPVEPDPIELAAASNHHGGGVWPTPLVRGILDRVRQGKGRPTIIAELTKEDSESGLPLEHLIRTLLRLVNDGDPTPAERDIRLRKLEKALVKSPGAVSSEELRSAL